MRRGIKIVRVRRELEKDGQWGNERDLPNLIQPVTETSFLSFSPASDDQT